MSSSRTYLLSRFGAGIRHIQTVTPIVGPSSTICRQRPERDLFLTCAKFITTPKYRPRLRERYATELELADRAPPAGPAA